MFQPTYRNAGSKGPRIKNDFADGSFSFFCIRNNGPAATYELGQFLLLQTRFKTSDQQPVWLTDRRDRSRIECC